MAFGWWLLIGMAVMVAAILLERRRQVRRMDRLGHKADGTAGRALGAGILELQGMLQPDRKVEILAMQAKEKEGSSELDADDQGEGPPPGGKETVR